MNDIQNDAPAAPPKKSGGFWAYFSAAVLLMAAGWEVHVYIKTTAVQKDWPRVTATVTAHPVKRVPGGRGGPQYDTYITYTYEVNGSTYAAPSVQVDRNAIHFSEQAAEEAVSAVYPKGGPVYVYYDPANPAKSTLPEESTDSLMRPAVFLIAAVALFLYARG